MSDDSSFLKTPDPLMVAQWAGLGRTLIAALAGAGILGGVWASVSAEQIADLLSAFLTVGGALLGAWAAFWSWRQKNAADKAKREAEVSAAKATAEATVRVGHATPVTVTVTPDGQDNEPVLISRAELAAAPSVPVGTTPSPAPRPAA